MSQSNNKPGSRISPVYWDFDHYESLWELCINVAGTIIYPEYMGDQIDIHGVLRENGITTFYVGKFHTPYATLGHAQREAMRMYRESDTFQDLEKETN